MNKSHKSFVLLYSILYSLQRRKHYHFWNQQARRFGATKNQLANLADFSGIMDESGARRFAL